MDDLQQHLTSSMPNQTDDNQPCRTNGSAVILVLLFLSAASVMVAQLSTMGTSGSQMLDAYEHRITADLAVPIAQTRILNAYMGNDVGLQKQLSESGSVLETSFETLPFRLAVVPESGKLDMFNAPISYIEKMLDALGLTELSSDVSAQLQEYRRSSDRYGMTLLLEKLARSAAVQSINIYDYLTLYSDQAHLHSKSISWHAQEMFAKISGLNRNGRQRPIYTFSVAFMANGTELPGQDWVVSFQQHGQYEILEKRYRVIPLKSF